MSTRKLLILLIVLFGFYKLTLYKIRSNHGTNSDSIFINPVNLDHINGLFELMHQKETQFAGHLRRLNLILFNDLMDSKGLINVTNEKSVYKIFEKDIQQYLAIGYQDVEANQHFLDYLIDIGNKYTTDEFDVTKYPLGKVQLI
jgi:hypothetical protein